MSRGEIPGCYAKGLWGFLEISNFCLVSPKSNSRNIAEGDTFGPSDDKCLSNIEEAKAQLDLACSETCPVTVTA